ncbi:family 16 glycosylhydrolase [Sungkyunkwania multivorans]|uniref:Family 16 glycosylhydrolase n=1 Tax=Sungkyunkwania multivorans TaxID=1173618 RepID=A0ABW3CYH0_9FLAO
MIQKTMYLLGVFVLSSCSKTTSNSTDSNQGPQSPEATAEWQLIFEENFDDPSLANWNPWNAGAFNNEIQLYRSAQLSTDNGILTIAAERMAIEGPTNPFDNTPKDFEYVSGRIESKSLYGPSNVAGHRSYRFTARIKLPKGNGMWPAFWSYGNEWPTNGEIDILEARGNRPMEFQSNIFYGTQPGVPLTMDAVTAKLHEMNVDLTEDYHEYEAIWTENQLRIIFDNEIIHTYHANPQNYIRALFGKKHRIVLNVAVGGVFFNNTNTNDFADDATMQIDWVRVYRQ